jgi:hypothetical protein
MSVKQHKIRAFFIKIDRSAYRTEQKNTKIAKNQR